MSIPFFVVQNSRIVKIFRCFKMYFFIPVIIENLISVVFCNIASFNKQQKIF